MFLGCVCVCVVFWFVFFFAPLNSSVRVYFPSQESNLCPCSGSSESKPLDHRDVQGTGVGGVPVFERIPQG